MKEIKMETTITVDLKSAKYRRPLTNVINEVAKILDNFIINKDLINKEIQFKGMKIFEQRSKLKVKYGFTDIDNRSIKDSRKNNKKEVVDGSKETGKGNKAT
jgi:hypothetical protein